MEYYSAMKRDHIMTFAGPCMDLETVLQREPSQLPQRSQTPPLASPGATCPGGEVAGGEVRAQRPLVGPFTGPGNSLCPSPLQFSWPGDISRAFPSSPVSLLDQPPTSHRFVFQGKKSTFKMFYWGSGEMRIPELELDALTLFFSSLLSLLGIEPRGAGPRSPSQPFVSFSLSP